MATSDKNKNNDTQIETESKGHTDGVSETQKIAIFALAAFIIGIGVGFVLAEDTGAPANTDEDIEAATSTQATSSNSTRTATTTTSITVNDQPAGETVLVDSATIDRVGWAAVYENRDGEPGNILGARLIPQAGEWSGTIPLLRNTEADRNYFVKLLGDDGDRSFNHEEDLPLAGEGGSDVMTEFKTMATSPRG